MQIANNIKLVKARIEKACELYDRNPKEITIVAACKACSKEKISQAIEAGICDFGENYLQEALVKIGALKALCSSSLLKWHFIGPIQRNKTRKIAQYFSWVHTVFREEIALRLNDQRSPCLPPLNVCVQLNISKEKTKSGLHEHELHFFLNCFKKLSNISLRGVMVIPQFTTDPSEQDAIYQNAQKLYNDLREEGWPLDTLSMGMSHDLEKAIKYGSTMVRVGRAIFGVRS